MLFEGLLKHLSSCCNVLAFHQGHFKFFKTFNSETFFKLVTTQINNEMGLKPTNEIKLSTLFTRTFRAQKFPRTEFFKTFTTGRK